jgi:hypothetical protein
MKLFTDEYEHTAYSHLAFTDYTYCHLQIPLCNRSIGHNRVYREELCLARATATNS